jgi:hypothetical protein
MSAPMTGALGEAHTCGSCSMCCKLLHIDEEELKKPQDKWCNHCRPGKGCSIYENRPPVCKDFACEWLIDPDMPDFWKPSVSNLLVTLTRVESLEGITAFMRTIHVNPGMSSIWRQEPYYSVIKTASRIGLLRDLQVLTQVRFGKRGWVILPNKDVHIAQDAVFTVGRTGEDTWEVYDSKDVELS